MSFGQHVSRFIVSTTHVYGISSPPLVFAGQHLRPHTRSFWQLRPLGRQLSVAGSVQLGVRPGQGANPAEQHVPAVVLRQLSPALQQRDPHWTGQHAPLQPMLHDEYEAEHVADTANSHNA